MSKQKVPINTNNQQAVPLGLMSPYFLLPFLLGTGSLFFGKNEADYNQASNFFAIAGTSLMTTNSTARTASAVGGFMRIFGPATFIGKLGFFMQGSAVAYALQDSMQRRNEQAPQP